MGSSFKNIFRDIHLMTLIGINVHAVGSMERRRQQTADRSRGRLFDKSKQFERRSRIHIRPLQPLNPIAGAQFHLERHHFVAGKGKPSTGAEGWCAKN